MPCWRPLDYALCLALLALGMAVRLWNLGAQSVWYDEYITLVALDAGSLSAALKQQLTYDWSMVPAYHILQYAWAHLIARSDMGIRWLSLIISAGCFPLLYAIALRLYGRWAAVVALLFLALTPYHIFHAQGIRNYPLALLASLLSVWCFLGAMDGHDSRRWWAGNLVANALLMWTHVFGIFLLAAQGLYLLCMRFKQRRVWLAWGIVHALMLVPVAAWIVMAQSNTGYPDEPPPSVARFHEVVFKHYTHPFNWVEYNVPATNEHAALGEVGAWLMRRDESNGYFSLRLRAGNWLSWVGVGLAAICVTAHLSRRAPNVWNSARRRGRHPLTPVEKVSPSLLSHFGLGQVLADFERLVEKRPDKYFADVSAAKHFVDTTLRSPLMVIHDQPSRYPSNYLILTKTDKFQLIVLDTQRGEVRSAYPLGNFEKVAQKLRRAEKEGGRILVPGVTGSAPVTFDTGLLAAAEKILSQPIANVNAEKGLYPVRQACPCFLALWLLLPPVVLFIMAWALQRTVFQERYFIYAYPALYIAIGAGVAALRWNLLRGAVVAVLAVLLSIQALAYQVVPIRPDALRAVQVYRQHVQPGDRLIIHRMLTQWLFLYNLHDTKQQYVSTGFFDEMVAETEKALRETPRVWVVMTSAPAHVGGDPEELAAAERFMEVCKQRGWPYTHNLFVGMQNYWVFRVGEGDGGALPFD